MGCCVVRGSAAGISDEGKRAYWVIINERQFCSTGVGITGAFPEVVKAFRILLADPHADQAFKALIVSAPTAGKLYALCGIYYTDPEQFEKYAAAFVSSRAQVETVMGCNVMSEPVSKIVKSTEPGAVRLKNRAATVKQWEEETKPKSMHYDIIGGGWPDIFKEEGGFQRTAR